MNNSNYPLVTMTMEQYEELNEKCDQLKAKMELANKAIWLVLDYFDTEDEKAEFINYIVSNTDDKDLCNFIEKNINRPKPKNILGDLPPEALGKLKENIESFIKFNPVQMHFNIPLFKADK